jgi:hypothetical protein
MKTMEIPESIFLSVLVIVFYVLLPILKLKGIITWPWWLVTAPIWLVVVGGIVFLVMLIQYGRFNH